MQRSVEGRPTTGAKDSFLVLGMLALNVETLPATGHCRVGIPDMSAGTLKTFIARHVFAGSFVLQTGEIKILSPKP